MDIICPHCKTTLEGGESFVGSDVTCPACNRDFSVPKLVAQGLAVPKPIAVSVVPVGVSPRGIPAGKRKKKGIVIGVVVGVLAALALFVFLGRERTYRAQHLYRTVAENCFSSLEFEEKQMQVFYDSLVLQAHELISPWYSMRNIRSLFGGRQRVLFEDEQDFGQIMVINGLSPVQQRMR